MTETAKFNERFPYKGAKKDIQMIDQHNPFESLEAYRTVKRNSLNTDVGTSMKLRQKFKDLVELVNKYETPTLLSAGVYDRQHKLTIEVLDVLKEAVTLFDCSVKRSRSDFNNPSENLLKHNVEMAKDKWEYISEQELHADGYCSVQFQGGVCNG